MKRCFIFLAIILLFYSCKNERVFETDNNAFESVNIKLCIDQGQSDNQTTKTLADFSMPSRYIFSLYVDGELAAHSVVSSPEFTCRVISGAEYDLLVWADYAPKTEDLYYDTQDLREVKVISSTFVTESPYSRDAFYGAREGIILSQNPNLSLTLKRPFAKLEVSTRTTELNPIFLPDNVKLNYLADSRFDVLHGVSFAETDLTWTSPRQIIGDKSKSEFEVLEEFIFVSNEASLESPYYLDFSLEFFKENAQTPYLVNDKLLSIPMSRNSLTKVQGELLTLGVDLEIKIEENIEAEDVEMEAINHFDIKVSSAGLAADLDLNKVPISEPISLKLSGLLSLEDFRVLGLYNIIELDLLLIENTVLPDRAFSPQISNYPLSLSLEKISLPSGIKEIGDYVFTLFSKLEEIVCNPFVSVDIGASAFLGTALDNAALENILSWSTKISNGQFAQCLSISMLYMPENIKSVEENAFYGCNNLQLIDLPYTNLFGISFAENAFPQQFRLDESESPRSINIPRATKAKYEAAGLVAYRLSEPPIEDLGEIEATAGRLSYALASLGIIQNTLIEELTLSGTLDKRDIEHLSKFDVAHLDISNVEILAYTEADKTYLSNQIPEFAWAGNKTLESINLPQNVSSIWSNAFAECENLVSVSFPIGNIISYGWKAFYGTKSLSEESIQAILNSYEAESLIQNQAFENCLQIQSITIPQNVEAIGYNAFKGCDNLRNVIIEGDNLPYLFIKNSDQEGAEYVFPADFYVSETQKEGTGDFIIYVQTQDFDAVEDWKTLNNFRRVEQI